MVDIFPYSTQDAPPVHGEQADKELTERLLPESQVYAGGFWLTKLSTQLRVHRVPVWGRGEELEEARKFSES